MDQVKTIISKVKDFLQKPYVIYIVILVLFLLTLFKPVEKGIQSIFTDKIYQSNVEYIEKISNDALISFGITSGIKAIIAVVHRFPVAGGLVKPVEDLVDIAWQTTLYASIILKILYYLLYFSHSFEFTLLAIFLLTFLITKLLSHLESLTWLKKLSASLAYFSLIFTLFIWLVLPFSIQGAKLLADMTTNKLIQNANQEIIIIEKEFNELKKELTKKISESTAKEKEIIAQAKEAPKKDSQENDSKKKDTLDKVSNFFSSTVTKIKKSAEKVAKEGDIIRSKIDNTIAKLEVALNFGLPTYIKKVELYTNRIKNLTIQMIAGYALNCLILPFLFIFLFSRFTGLLKEQFFK